MDIPSALQHWPLQAVLAIVAGAVVLLAPRVLNYAIGAYLIAVGSLGLLHVYYGQTIRPQTILALVTGVLVLIRPNILSYVVGIYLILLGLLESGVIRI